MELASVVLSGGAGTRLWPASRQAYPKPFIRLGGSALLEQAIVRGQACDTGDLLIGTNQDHLFLTQGLLANMQDPPNAHCPLEPKGHRNTAQPSLWRLSRAGTSTEMVQSCSCCQQTT